MIDYSPRIQYSSYIFSLILFFSIVVDASAQYSKTDTNTQYSKYSSRERLLNHISNSNESIQRIMVRDSLDSQIKRRIDEYINSTNTMARKIARYEQYDSDEGEEFFNNAYNKVSQYTGDILEAPGKKADESYLERLSLASLDIRLMASAIIKPFMRKLSFRKISVIVAVQKKINGSWAYRIGDVSIFEVSNENRTESYKFDNKSEMDGRYFAHFVIFPGVHYFWGEVQDISQTKILNYDSKPSRETIDYTSRKRIINIKTHANF